MRNHQIQQTHCVSRLFGGDPAVLIGIVIAALGVWLIHKFNKPYFDPEATLVTGLVLIGAAFLLTRKAAGLLVGERLDRDQIAHVSRIITTGSAVASVGQLGAAQIGPDSALLTATVRVKGGLNPRKVEQERERQECSIMLRYPSLLRRF